MKKWIALGVFALIVIILLVMSIGSYNGLVRENQAVNSSWAQVQNVYQRREDLIPNLVQTVQGAANFEKSTLEEVTKARKYVSDINIDASKAPDDAATLQKYQDAQGQLSNALSRLLSVAENYPQLKSNANFLALQTQLEGTENRISVERRNFNQAVQDYNTSVHSFPSVIFASMFGFHDRPYFQADVTAQTAPAVKFDFGK